MEDEKWLTLSEAAKQCFVVRQAIFSAVKQGKIPCQMKKVKIEKKNKNGIFIVEKEVICIKQSDLNIYREKKYDSSKKEFEGVKLYDIENLRFSVLQASKWFAETLGKYVPPQRIYYLIKIGNLEAKRHGKFLVIEGKALKDLWEREGGQQELQLG